MRFHPPVCRLLLGFILLAGLGCQDSVERKQANESKPPPREAIARQTTPDSRESFLVRFHSAHKERDQRQMDLLCRENPKEAEWSMVQLSKMVAYFDDLRDHPALAGTEIGGEVVGPGELRELTRDLEARLGPASRGLKAEAIESYGTEKSASAANAVSDEEEWSAYLEAFDLVDDGQYDNLLREFTLARFKGDLAVARSRVAANIALIPPLLRDYMKLLVAMAAHTNLKSVSFKWSGAVEWNVPKLFDVIAAMAYLHSDITADPASKKRVAAGLEAVISASLQAADRAEKKGDDHVAIDKFTYVESLGEMVDAPEILKTAFHNLSRLYYQQGDMEKAREFAEKERRVRE